MSIQDSFNPIGGKDYPRNLAEFHHFFPHEKACYSYLERLRWSDGFICPGCGSTNQAWRTGRDLFLCSHCRRQISVTANTIFEKTRKPLLLWFLAIWELTSQKYGANALGIKRVLGLGGYLTAWAWLHKLRRAMVRPGRDRLSGTVEVDESYVGGEEKGVRGRKTDQKAIVAIAVEMKDPKGFGRIRLRHVEDVSAECLVGFISDVVQIGATIRTDGWRGYAPLKSKDFDHKVIVMSDSPDPAHVLMPGPHRVSALLKRWLAGTYQGAVNNKHLDYYLDEYTFRFNRRTSHSRGLLFYRLVCQAVQTEHTSTHLLFKETGRGVRVR
jgi:transposase-like protein